MVRASRRLRTRTIPGSTVSWQSHDAVRSRDRRNVSSATDKYDTRNLLFRYNYVDERSDICPVTRRCWLICLAGAYCRSCRCREWSRGWKSLSSSVICSSTFPTSPATGRTKHSRSAPDHPAETGTPSLRRVLVAGLNHQLFAQDNQKLMKLTRFVERHVIEENLRHYTGLSEFLDGHETTPAMKTGHCQCQIHGRSADGADSQLSVHAQSPSGMRGMRR